MNTFFDELGEYGPLLLICVSWYLLWNKKQLFFYYNIGIFVNIILNILLKGIIQEPRPIYNSKKISLLKTHGKGYFFQNGVPFDMFGMPSGHAQTSFFSTIFIYMTLRENKWLFIYMLSSIITCYQRIKFNYHTLNQVLVGSIVGSIFSYLVYIFYKEQIKGEIAEKPDDNAPI